MVMVKYGGLGSCVGFVVVENSLKTLVRSNNMSNNN